MLGNRGRVGLEADDPLVVVNFHALVQLGNHLNKAFSCTGCLASSALNTAKIPVKKSSDTPSQEGEGAFLPEPRFHLSSRGEDDDQEAIKRGEKRVFAG